MALDYQTTDDADWAGWLQDIGTKVVGTIAQVKVAETQQLGQNGYYVEGKRVTTPVNVAAQQAGINSTTLLLIGAAVFAVLMLKG